VDTGLALLAHSHVPFVHWDSAFETAYFLINRLPSSVNRNSSPYELLFHKSPDYKFLKVFGCECWPYLRPYNSHKFAFRSKPCVFIGYSLSHHGYKCLDPLTNWVYIARHVVFNEQVFPFQKSPSHTEPSPSSLSGLLPLPSISLPQNSYNPCLFTHAPRSSSSPTRVMSFFFSHPPAPWSHPSISCHLSLSSYSTNCHHFSYSHHCHILS